METTKATKSGFSAVYKLCPIRHTILLMSGALITVHLLTRDNHAWNAGLSEHVVRPIHRALSLLTAHTSVSVAELLIALAAVGLLGYLLWILVSILRKGEAGKKLYRLLVSYAAFGLAVYAGFCLLWGVYYYGDDFTAKSGLPSGNISVDELRTVTAYFAGLANTYAQEVPRDENGVCATSREEILAKSPLVYARAQELFPCLEGPAIRAKGVYFSHLLSYTDFTGFFFPFTAEANVNTDFPPSLFASTVAHELAHQRGVAKEQEANFAAVLASLLYGDPEYCYSACLLAYTHLGNALYSVDREAWEEIYAGLDDAVLRDYAANRAYWRQFDTPVQTVSNTVYEQFLYSYDQDLGLRSYGACVDLLVNYYYETAAAFSDPTKSCP